MDKQHATALIASIDRMFERGEISADAYERLCQLVYEAVYEDQK